MPAATLFGLILMGLGIFTFFISRTFTHRIARFRSEWFQPDLDRAAYARRHLRIIRIMTMCWVALGFGFTVTGLILGR